VSGKIEGALVIGCLNIVLGMITIFITEKVTRELLDFAASEQKNCVNNQLLFIG